jgi:hypothetical protein
MRSSSVERKRLASIENHLIVVHIITCTGEVALMLSGKVTAAGTVGKRMSTVIPGHLRFKLPDNSQGA